MAQHFCGAQAPMRRSTATARPQNAGSRVIFRTQLPAQHVAGQQRRAPRTPLSVYASSGNGTSMLPWQAAMDEVKKRKDLKSIMIIGAGPIVIGQVCTWFGEQRHRAGAAAQPKRVPLNRRNSCATSCLPQACEFDYSGTQACKSLRCAAAAGSLSSNGMPGLWERPDQANCSFLLVIACLSYVCAFALQAGGLPCDPAELQPSE
jgi:hypothetical protein